MEKADLILYCNAIFTGSSLGMLDGAVAIKGNKIIFVGSREEAEVYKTGQTVLKEVKDGMIMSGFGDAHAHFMQGALMTSDSFCSALNEAHSEEECVQMMVEFRKKHPNLERYFGYGWLPSYWGNAPFPTKESLDPYFPDVPVYLRAVDGHSEWMNSAALKESGYLTGWKPQYGSVDTLPNGELSGLVREGGDLLSRQFDTKLPDSEVKRLQREFIKSLNEVGITTFTEMGAQLPEAIDSEYGIVKQIEEEGELTIRLLLYPGTEIQPERISELAEFKKRYQSEMLKINGLKGFADGVTSTYTAAMLEPYSDKPDDCGYLNHPVSQYHEWVKEANRQGYGIRVHCIGDRAVRTILDACEESNKCNDNRGVRNTIEHIEVIHPSDITRFQELGVVASMQPLHLPLDEFDKISRCGVERSKFEWAHKSILRTGAVLALGTDYPIADYAPLPNIYQAITRKGINGVQYGNYSTDEKMSLEEALLAYTYGTAFALNMEDKTGNLEVGKYADLIVLNKNLFQIETEDILTTSVLMTMVDGKIVYEKK